MHVHMQMHEFGFKHARLVIRVVVKYKPLHALVSRTTHGETNRASTTLHRLVTRERGQNRQNTLAEKAGNTCGTSNRAKLAPTQSLEISISDQCDKRTHTDTLMMVCIGGGQNDAGTKHRWLPQLQRPFIAVKLCYKPRLATDLSDISNRPSRKEQVS